LNWFRYCQVLFSLFQSNLCTNYRLRIFEFELLYYKTIGKNR
jgi:hypothetical protein